MPIYYLETSSLYKVLPNLGPRLAVSAYTSWVTVFEILAGGDPFDVKRATLRKLLSQSTVLIDWTPPTVLIAGAFGLGYREDVPLEQIARVACDAEGPAQVDRACIELGLNKTLSGLTEFFAEVT